MRLLLLGGTGFISASIVRRLLAEGHEVTTLTRGRTPDPFGQDARVDRRHGDRRSEADLLAAMGGRRFDAVIDMTAFNGADTRTALKVCAPACDRFVHCSTVSVYMVSDQVTCPITEDQALAPLMPDWPRNPFGMGYGIDKRACEEELWRAHAEGRTAVTVLRPTFVAGPRDPGRRDWFWIERILDGKPLLVPGSGDFVFQMVYVEDTAAAFASALRRPESVGKAYTVAAEEIFSLNAYLERLAALLDREVDLIHVDQEVFDAQAFSYFPGADVFPYNTRRPAVFSLEAAKRDLGFRSTPWETWISETIGWFREHDASPSWGYDKRQEEVAFALSWRRARAALRFRYSR